MDLEREAKWVQLHEIENIMDRLMHDVDNVDNTAEDRTWYYDRWFALGSQEKQLYRELGICLKHDIDPRTYECQTCEDESLTASLESEARAERRNEEALGFGYFIVIG